MSYEYHFYEIRYRLRYSTTPLSCGFLRHLGFAWGGQGSRSPGHRRLRN